jgi:hypothetical protein
MSGDSEKPRVDPNATIELDAIEGLEGIELSVLARKATAANVGSRPTPPPLPPEPSALAMATAAQTAAGAGSPPRSVGKTVAYGAVLVAVVGLAMAAGLSVGSRARAKFGAAHAAPVPVPPTSSVVAPPVSVRELTLPPIEIKGP